MPMRFSLIFLSCFVLSGCIVFLEYPPEETITGTVVLESGEPVGGAMVRVWDDRKFLSFPSMSYPSAAFAETDSNGTFEVTAKFKWPVKVTASMNCGIGRAEIKASSPKPVKIKVANKC